mmetsp:Transcript_5054/g.17543  ORF Transcript_5054/g.17543 Transcript_5054/m.17543 type:complete len:260 (+) Transcript_5054:340-1119(+)
MTAASAPPPPPISEVIAAVENSASAHLAASRTWPSVFSSFSSFWSVAECSEAPSVPSARAAAAHTLGRPPLFAATFAIMATWGATVALPSAASASIACVRALPLGPGASSSCASAAMSSRCRVKTSIPRSPRASMAKYRTLSLGSSRMALARAVECAAAVAPPIRPSAQAAFPRTSDAIFVIAAATSSSPKSESSESHSASAAAAAAAFSSSAASEMTAAATADACGFVLSSLSPASSAAGIPFPVRKALSFLTSLSLV